MPSVTEILDYSTPPYLAKWFKNNSAAKCDKIALETSECGKLVDLSVQEDIKNGKYTMPVNDQNALNCLGQWEQLKVDHPLFVPSIKEMQAEVRAFGIVGHPDFICQEENGWGVADLKCTSGIRAKNWIQEATYAAMLMVERGWAFPSFVRTLRLPRDGSAYEWLEIRDSKMIKSLMKMFDGYVEVFNSEKVINEFFRMQLEDQLLGGF